jgi:thioredoxin-like negative regulator of GroEL
MTSDSSVLESRLTTGTVLAVFTAKWAPAGRLLVRSLEDQQSSFEDVTLVTVDVDEAPHLADRYLILAVPAVAVLVDGQLRSRSVGAVSAASCVALLDEVSP